MCCDCQWLSLAHVVFLSIWTVPSTVIMQGTTGSLWSGCGKRLNWLCKTIFLDIAVTIKSLQLVSWTQSEDPDYKEITSRWSPGFSWNKMPYKQQVKYIWKVGYFAIFITNWSPVYLWSTLVTFPFTKGCLVLPTVTGCVGDSSFFIISCATFNLHHFIWMSKFWV